MLDIAGVGASKTLSISLYFKNIEHNAFAGDLKTELDLVFEVEAIHSLDKGKTIAEHMSPISVTPDFNNQ